jgi:hypothetical protein
VSTHRLHSDVYVRKPDGLWKIEAQAWGRIVSVVLSEAPGLRDARSRG